MGHEETVGLPYRSDHIHIILSNVCCNHSIRGVHYQTRSLDVSYTELQQKFREGGPIWRLHFRGSYILPNHSPHIDHSNFSDQSYLLPSPTKLRASIVAIRMPASVEPASFTAEPFVEAEQRLVELNDPSVSECIRVR